MALLTENWTLIALSLLIGVLTVTYLYLKHIYTYWKRKGFKFVPGGSIIFGHMDQALYQKESFGDLMERLYNSTDEPFIGMYTILRPVLLLRDPQLIRRILIKDFANFGDRGIHIDEEYDPLSANLLALKGQKWRTMRSKLTPTFTLGKLKAMFSLFVDCGVSLYNYLEKLANSGKLLDVREIAAQHATNVIASVAFGIDVDTIVDPEHDFRKYGRKIFEPNLKSGLRVLIAFVVPKLMALLRLKATDTDVELFLRSMVKQTLDHREKSGVVRKDFIQLLVQLRNTGTVQLDGEWETRIRDENQKLWTEDEVTAQAFAFFVGGFETTSTTTSFCLYEIVKNAEIQQRVHDEIDQVMEKYDGNVTYESLAEPKYLDACLEETLRLHSVAPMLTRTCAQDYQIPGTDKIIEKGTEVFVPVYSIQRDANYYENPKTFNPERFTEGSSAGNDKPFMPFGEGPRSCIGQRLGRLQSKMGVFTMLQNFRFELNDNQKDVDFQLDPKSFIPIPRDGFHLRVFKR